MAFEILTEEVLSHTFVEFGVGKDGEGYRSWQVTNHRVHAFLSFPELAQRIEVDSLHSLPNPLVILRSEDLNRRGTKGHALVVLPMKLKCKSRLSRLAFEFARQVLAEWRTYRTSLHGPVVERQAVHA